jgi:Zn-dependent peptidase ImmA (M78 family)/DNA-binding XRE family transcriptional regulator
MSGAGAVLGFDRDRLKLARLAAGLRKNELADRVQVTPSAISQYENGLTKPSPSTLASLALALGVPAGFFARRRPLDALDQSAAHFRSLRASTQRERNQAFAHSVLIWDIVRALERHVRFPERAIPDHAPPDHATRDTIEAIAGTVRADWALEPGPVDNTVRLLEAHGTIVSRLQLGLDRVDAFSCDFGTRPVVTLLVDKHNPVRTRWDTAHELGHLVMHHDNEPGDATLEHQANTFAAGFLLPADQIADQLPRRINWDHLAQLKHTWGVSVRALLYRARTLLILSDATYRRALITLNQNWGSHHEPGDLGMPEQPALLRKALELANTRGYTLTNLADDVQLPAEQVAALISLDTDPPVVSP